MMAKNGWKEEEYGSHGMKLMKNVDFDEIDSFVENQNFNVVQ